MTLTFARESLIAIREEAEPLLRREWEAASEDRELFPYDPNWVLYAALEKAGSIRFFTMRDAVLLGYIGFYVSWNAHSQRLRTATSDVWWVEPSARFGGASMRLVAYAETALAEEGVRVAHIQTNERHPAPARMLEHSGHRLVGHLWSKNLGVEFHA